MFFGGKIVVWTSNEWILVKIFKIRDVPFFGLFNEFENTPRILPCRTSIILCGKNKDFKKDSVNFLLELSGFNPSSAILMATRRDLL